ncbi:hypothetical protein [Spirosoma sp. 209]|uniref:hypothetical protein n=1 Tax=Spirosoma sp. 209 TaxID=1955701 RepID=UPI00098D3820|nr:hypothetical protein [Spirosoma sp. 209]
MNATITATCTIRNGMIWVNGQLYHETDLAQPGPALFAERAYRTLSLAYPKFFKMDPLSKLGWLAAELMTQPAPEGVRPDQRGVVLYSRTGSLLADWSHQQILHDNRPVSPAIFVYTLPNIVVGELCIRHQLMGENGVFLTPAWQPHHAALMVNSLLTSGDCRQCLTGWIEVNADQYEVFLCQVNAQPNDTAGMPFSDVSLQILYQNPAAYSAWQPWFSQEATLA